MKKVSAIVLAVMLVLALAVPAMALGNFEVLTINAAYDSSISISGTVESGCYAVAVQILDGSNNILAMESFTVNENAFSGSIENVTLSPGTYTARAANYDGGTWCNTEFTVAAPFIPVVVSEYKLSFNTNGGSSIAAISGTYGKVIDLSQYKPELAGKIFVGWFSDAALENPVSKVKLTGNMTVYAKWTEDVFGKYSDLKQDAWYAGSVRYCLGTGLMVGVSSDKFAPGATADRAMIVTMLYRLAGEPAFMNDNIFNDVAEGSYYERAVVWANGKAITDGYGDGTFRPTAPITREQLACMLYRYCEYMHNYMDYELTPGSDDALEGFTDSAQVSSWAQDAMKWACSFGLFKGYNNELTPQADATRAQVAAVIERFCTSILK